MNKEPKFTDTKKPLLAIHCMVYNHAPFLRECFEGFVMQQTSFPFVAIVHDDASTDNSAEIIREYEAKYPHIFKPIYQIENQHSKPGVSVVRLINEAILKTGAKYIAMCEGDDYWTDPMKLQRQVDFLEENPDYSLSAENATRLYIGSNKTELFSTLPSRDITISEMITTRQFATASVVYRSGINIPSSVKRIYDTLLWCIIAQYGKVHYENIISSIYRIGAGVTQVDKVAWAHKIIELNNLLYATIKIDKKTCVLHDKEMLAILLAGIREALRKKKYADVRSLGVYILTIGIVPWILLIKQVVDYKIFQRR